MYAVVTTGGKQVKVAEGDVIRVEKLEVNVGETIELEDVKMIGNDDGVGDGNGVGDSDGKEGSMAPTRGYIDGEEGNNTPTYEGDGDGEY